METESIIKLTESFFKNLKCEMLWKDNALIITKVPEDFEKLYGKSSPYIFAFDEETNKNNPDSELITKGSLVLKLMAIFLENKAKTSILKINFEPDLRQMVEKSIDLKGYKIINVAKEIGFDYIYRFTFMTTLQYLNEKESVITPIYINNNNILNDFNVENYPAIAGKKEETKKERELLEETKANYALAKENLKLMLQKRTKEVSYELNKSLEIALQRINSHYNHMIEELNKIQETNIKNLELSKQKILKSNEKNRQILSERIERLENAIKNSKIKEDTEKLEKEKQFFLSDEKYRHSINLNNSLMNTTIIYYPIFNFRINIQAKNSKEISFIYHPIKEELSKIICDGCKKEIKEIILCDSNHLSCKECISICPRCSKRICKACKNISCSICGGKICEKCATLCNVCKKHICNSDIRKDNSTGKDICASCADFCQSCNKFSSKTEFKNCDSCRTKVCRKCIKSKYVNGKTMNLCNQCYNKISSKPVFSI